ncbi:MAG: hypothetical protein JXB13_01445 [Phycisphaerae bacterium]|nr:hypothetical protein [Phycisphaerae bacterium]
MGRPVKITRRRRSLGGQVGTVRDFFWRKDEAWIVVQLPSGIRAAVPACWTDVPREDIPAKQGSPLVDPSRLLELARYCRELSTRARAKPRRKRRKAK